MPPRFRSAITSTISWRLSLHCTASSIVHLSTNPKPFFFFTSRPTHPCSLTPSSPSPCCGCAISSPSQRRRFLSILWASDCLLVILLLLSFLLPTYTTLSSFFLIDSQRCHPTTPSRATGILQSSTMGLPYVHIQYLMWSAISLHSSSTLRSSHCAV